MFDLFEMTSNYEMRKVARFEKGELFIDTVAVTDSDKPFETAIGHPDYNDDGLIIVELYDTKEEAQIGHDKWVNVMTSDTLPAVLKDVSTAEIAKFAKIITDDEMIFEKR